MSDSPSAAERSQFKPKAYFDQWIARHTQTLDEFQAIADGPQTQPEHRQSLLHSIFRRRLELLIARYSRGDAKAVLAGAFPAVIDALAEYQREAGPGTQNFNNFDAYVYALWILSLGILLDVDRDLLDRAIAELNNRGRDAIFDRLLALRLPGLKPAANVLYPEPYGLLLQALGATGKERTQGIQEFLANYYGGMLGAYWHGSHGSDDTGFFGYWCFELAAFVKAMGIDDTAFADNPFYPRDLVR